MGDITTQRISIEEGARLKGSVKIPTRYFLGRLFLGLLFPEVRLLSQKKDDPFLNLMVEP